MNLKQKVAACSTLNIFIHTCIHYVTLQETINAFKINRAAKRNQSIRNALVEGCSDYQTHKSIKSTRDSITLDMKT